MILNVIDFNDYLKKSHRNRFCIYRNLELGHEIHVYNENSKLMKACQSTIEPDIKKALSEMHFSPTYEYYKLFLMLQLEGWFIEADTIFYDLDLNPKKTSPMYCHPNDNIFFSSFCTWEPIFIKLDPTTKFFLKRSLETLKIFLRYRYLPTPFELSYQTITFDFDDSQLFFDKSALEMKLSFCEYLDKNVLHCADYGLINNKTHYSEKHPDDFLLVQHYNDADHGKPCTEKIITYDDLLKFDTFKIMP